MSEINLDELTVKYFNFLVEDFNFARENNKYISDNVVIEIRYGRFQPFVTIMKINEPDFTKLGMNWFFYYYKENFDVSSIQASDLEIATQFIFYPL